MNREIKFRAWDSKSQRMYYQGEPDLENIQSFFHHYNDNDELMQFTGLYDKNGNEIYEGDILLSEHREFLYKVIYRRGNYAISFKSKNEEQYTDIIIAKYCKVIGNIHEPPELLK